MTGISPLSVKSASSESGMSLGGSTRPCPRVMNTESLKMARQSTSKERCLKYMPSLKFPACTRHNSPTNSGQSRKVLSKNVSPHRRRISTKRRAQTYSKKEAYGRKTCDLTRDAGRLRFFSHVEYSGNRRTPSTVAKLECVDGLDQSGSEIT